MRPERRRWLGAGIAVAAAAGGAAWWRFVDPGRDPLPPDFWALRFERPEGGELAFETLRGAPLLVNFWATWCPPCITELPLIDAFAARQKAAGWQVVGLAVDGPTPVRSFLATRPLGFAVGLAGLDGVQLGRSLGNQSGGLPFSIVVDRAGRIAARKLGALHAPDLEAWGRLTL